MKKVSDYIKANRRGSREAELELNKGFKSMHKVHKSEKTYTRKPKHPKSFNTEE
jgi:hypothetical protein